MTRAAGLRARFLRYHCEPPAAPTPGILVTPNPWDVGSARLLVDSGAAALATTSAGHAASQGRLDQDVNLAQLLKHVKRMTTAVDVPVSVDAEDCFGEDVAGVAATAQMLRETDAAGFSIEDYDPELKTIRSIGDAAARVTAAKEAGGDLVVTARSENLLYGTTGLDETITRLCAYRSAGADVVYAPGLVSGDDIARVVDAVDCPVNVLALPGTPSVPELAAMGVARVSVGSLLCHAAYGAMLDAVAELFGPGTSDYTARTLSTDVKKRAFC